VHKITLRRKIKWHIIKEGKDEVKGVAEDYSEDSSKEEEEGEDIKMPRIVKLKRPSKKWKYRIVLKGVTVAYARSYSGAKYRSNQIYGQMRRKRKYGKSC